jgi:hypothetical protein
MKKLDFEKLYPNRQEAPPEEKDYYGTDGDKEDVAPEIAPEDVDAKEEEIESLREKLEGEFAISPVEAGKQDIIELNNFLRKIESEILKESKVPIDMDDVRLLIMKRHDEEFFPRKMREIEEAGLAWAESMTENIKENKDCLDGFAKPENIALFRQLIKKGDKNQIREFLAGQYISARIDTMQKYEITDDTNEAGEDESGKGDGVEDSKSPFQEGYVPDELEGKSSRSPFKKGYEPQKSGQKKWWQFWK